MFSACHVVHLLCLCVCTCLLLKVMLSKVIDICSMIFFKIVKCHLWLALRFYLNTDFVVKGIHNTILEYYLCSRQSFVLIWIMINLLLFSQWKIKSNLVINIDLLFFSFTPRMSHLHTSRYSEIVPLHNPLTKVEF